jgi:cyclopropane-fatty-acyl-phospholipid synthase
MNNHHEIVNSKIPGEAKVILEGFSKIDFGTITITTPDNMTLQYSGKNNGPIVGLHIYDWNVLVEVLNKSDIGLAETYITKKWDTSSIEDLIELSILNESALIKAFKGNWAKIIFYRLKHEARENTKKGARKNIQEHYDLGNDFYKLWLDPTLSYSSALYLDPNESLESAQNNKYQSMLDLIRPSAGEHIVEIGCGWGGFLEYAGKKGYRVTGITISEEQFKFATERIKNLGLESLVTVKICDYRDLEGNFDHAVSIEMIEAVGEKYWDSYMETFKKVLKPTGRFAIQAIIINDNDFASYKKGTDFIQQYIFPGGMLLSPNTIKSLIEKKNYQLIAMKDFGLDYAKTLHIWKDAFNSQVESVKKLNFDEAFIRLWNFYLGYCEGAFKSKRIDVVQFSARISHE